MAKVNLSIKAILTRISVLFILLIAIEQSLVNSALADISKAFPTVDPTMVSLVSTIPTIFSILISFLFLPQLVKIFDKRNILLAALFIYIVGGVSGAFLNSNIYMLLIGRALVGVGVGLSAPLCGAIINELYSGIDRANMLGWANAIGSIMSIILTMIAGALCTINWKYTFLGYTFFIIVFIMEYFFLPSMPVPVVKDASGTEKKAKIEFTSKQKFKLVCIILYAFICSLVGMSLMVKTAILIGELGLGNALAAASAISSMTTGMMVVSFIYGLLERFLKRYTLVLLPLSSCIGIYLMRGSTSLSYFLVCGFIAGIGMGLVQPVLTSRVTAIGPTFNGAFSNSLMLGCSMLGQFCATFSDKVIGLFTTPTAQNIILSVSVGFGVLTIITLIYVIWNPLNGVNEERMEDRLAA